MKKVLIFPVLIALLTAALLLPAPALAQTETPPAPTAAPLDTFGVTLASDSAARSGPAGSTVVYNLTLKNTGSAADTFDVSCSGGWTVSCPVDLGPVKPGKTSKFEVRVTIPTAAENGTKDIASVTVTSRGDGSTAASVNLTTTAAFARPLVVVSSYSVSGGAITPGQDFNIKLVLANVGKSPASNLVISFESSDFLPRDTGGVRAITSLGAGNSVEVSQSMASSIDLAGKTIATLAGNLSYTDAAGTAYSEAFTFTVNLNEPVYYGSSATATPTASLRPQLVVSTYQTNVDPLQPGTIFNLDLEVHNLGNADARAVTMVLGGGVSSGDGSGTPQPGGVSGSGGDLTNFAPLGSSNLQYLGDVTSGMTMKATSQLIVNVNTQPGAYPLKLSFVYTDSKGNRIVDDQVITLLVYSLPQVEVSFYRDPGMLFTGQPNMLPLQVTNLGRKSSVLGNMKVTAEGADVTNNTMLVGTLDPGGYFTLDAQLMPFQAGPLTLNITINYTDDFNQPRLIETKLDVMVEEMPTPEPGMGEGTNGEMPPVVVEETFWDKVLRFVKGLLGLDSGKPQPGIEAPVDSGMNQEPMPGESKPIPAP